MAGNGAESGGASISAAAGARFHARERRSRWAGCFGGLSCFGSQKGGTRIVPASRTPDGNASTSRGGAQATGPSNPNTNLNLSILAPPSSPASFINSALPSTVQSPNCFPSLSANSPGDPTSTMFMTGPYAHETQLVSPPVFSTFTTEPSTAPLTPPPELAFLTTPSSPDVPYAQYLSSSLNLKGTDKQNDMRFLSSGYSVGSDLQTTYPLYPGSPLSSLISPASGTPRTGLSSPFPETSTPSHDSVTSKNFMLSTDSSFFRPAASAQFHLDHAQQSFPSHSSCANRHGKASKQDIEELEAYRASFGFSADEIITTQHYVEISDPADDNFTMSPFGNNKPCTETFTELTFGGQAIGADRLANANHGNSNSGGRNEADTALNRNCESIDIARGDGGLPFFNGGDERLSKSLRRQHSKRILSGQSCSDAEIEYRRARSLKEAHIILARRASPS